MIYICEYDRTADDRILGEYIRFLPPYQTLPASDASEAQDKAVRAEDVSGVTERRPPSEGNDRRFEKMRQRVLAWLLTEYAVRHEYDGHYRKPFELLDRLEIRRDIHGKPYSRVWPELCFNISHCDAACACILSDTPAGVDIECKFPYKERLEKGICHREELSLLETMQGELRAEQLRLLWSMKESFVKLDGRGLAYGMKRVDLSPLLPVELFSGKDRGGRCSADTGARSGQCTADADVRSGQCAAELDGYGRLLFFIESTGAYTFAACGKSLPGQIYYVAERDLLDMSERIRKDGRAV